LIFLESSHITNVKDLQKGTKMLKRIKKGFTLIELLVVIAIIALLLAILMPSLKKAKDKAKQIVCKAHLKDIGLSIKMYLQDNENKPPTRLGGAYGWINPDTGSEYEDTGNGYSISAYWGVAFKDYAKNKKIFSCVSFAQFKLDLASTWDEYIMTPDKIQGGYAINPHFQQNPRNNDFGIAKVSSIKSPSEFIVAQDHVEPLPEDFRDGDIFSIRSNTSDPFNLPGYRPGGNRPDFYRGIFRHCKKNSALDVRACEDTTGTGRIAEINSNPNGQSDTLYLDGSVDGMDETNGKNVRKSWYTGE